MSKLYRYFIYNWLMRWYVTSRGFSIELLCVRCSFWWLYIWSQMKWHMLIFGLILNGTLAILAHQLEGYGKLYTLRTVPNVSFTILKCFLFSLFVSLYSYSPSGWLIHMAVLTPAIILASIDTSEGSCQEEKILYKLVSGLHSSISVHIASDYLLDEATNLVRSAVRIWLICDMYFLSRYRMTQRLLFFVFQWGQNLTLLYDRVLRYPDRVQNLYFTFLFVLRAVTKVSYLPLYFSVWILGKGSQWSRIVTISFFCMICRQKITWERLNMRLVMWLRTWRPNLWWSK